MADSWTGPADGSDPVLDRILGRNQPRRSQWLGPLMVAVPILLVTAALWFVTTQPPMRDLIWSIPPGSPLSSVPSRSPAAAPAAADSSRPRATRSHAARPASVVMLPVEIASAEESSKRSDREKEDAVENSSTTTEEQSKTPVSPVPTTETTPAKRDAGSDRRIAKSPAEALALPVGQNFNQIRIQEVVDYLTESTGVRFELDMKSLWFDQGTTRNVPVTLEAEKMSVRDFLEEVVVKRLKAAYLVGDDKIVITSHKAANKAATPDKQ